MNGDRRFRRLAAVSAAVLTLGTAGCAFQGLNSLPLPGAVGRGHDALVYHVEIANIGTLEPNSPVLLGDVVVGSIAKIRAVNWHAELDISLKPDTVVPANAVATVGQTSLLGSMHLALGPPLGQRPQGQLTSGATIGMDRTLTYPSTEQTLSSLSAVVNGGGLGQISDVIHNSAVAVNGRQEQIRDLLDRLDTFVGTLDSQRANIVATLDQVNRFSGTVAGQKDALDRLLHDLPPALDVLVRERPRITTALATLGSFSDTATDLINKSQQDLVADLSNLAPAIQALADTGPDLNAVIASYTTFPYSQAVIDRAVKGDYMNLNITIDLTVARLKRTLLLGTRWEQPGAVLVPAPGEPQFLNYTYNPLVFAATPPPPAAPDEAPTSQGAESVMPAVSGPLLPVTPPPMVAPPSDIPTIFAGPFPPSPSAPAAGPSQPKGN